MSRAPAKLRAAKTTKAAPPTRQPVRQVRARWDAAQTNDDNRRHWAMADGLSADAAASPQVRRILRNRARYEVANNTYAKGLVHTLANDCIGTGARPHFSGMSAADASFVKREFAAWADEVELAEILRTMRSSRIVDGESFALLINNLGLEAKVKLDLRLIEPEQVAHTNLQPLGPNMVDGIEFDKYGNPTVYNVLPQHPGGLIFLSTQPVPTLAKDVLHFFIPERPGQRRGIPELTPSLPLFAQLRRWTLAVIAAAETAADMAAILRSTDPAAEAAESKPFDRVEFEQRAMVTLPVGWTAEQMKAEHPNSTYSDVKNQLIAEVARCMQVPFIIAAGNSSGANYASGRLDFQSYHKSLRVDRARLQRQVLDRVFNAWKQEAILIEGYLPQTLRTVQSDWSHLWFFDGNEHVDPLKEANAQKVRLDNLTSTLSDEWGGKGADWEEKLVQIAKEKAKMKKLGLTIADVTAPGAAPVAQPAAVGDPGIDDNGDLSDEE